MNTSSRQIATFYTGSDSPSLYSEDDGRPDSNPLGTQSHHRSSLEPDIGGLPCDDARDFDGTSASSIRKGLTSPCLNDGQGLNLDASGNYTPACPLETQQEARARHSQSVTEATPLQHNIWRDTTLDESRIYLQRILAEHDATNEGSSSDGYRKQDQVNGEPSARHMALASHNMCPINSNAGSLQHRRGTLLSTTSLISTDSGEQTEVSNQSDGYRNMLQDGTHTLETAEDVFQPVTPRPRALILPDTPSELQLHSSNSLASDGSAHQSTALPGFDGADGESEKPLSTGASDQRVQRSTHRSSLAARRQGLTDWRDRALLSSTGQMYGLGDPEEGYVAGRYVTVIEEDAQPEKEKRRRDAWKRVSCF
ncbi:hypothetical protein IG631_12925 [Alternaria alternata]|nr:hypothetical protein IG631_12925 [Alternaria alternata]